MQLIIKDDPSRKYHLWFDSDLPRAAEKLAFVWKLSFAFDAIVEVVFLVDTKKTNQQMLHDAWCQPSNDCMVTVHADAVVQLEMKSKPHFTVFPKNYGEAKLGYVNVEYFDAEVTAAPSSNHLCKLRISLMLFEQQLLTRERHNELWTFPTEMSIAHYAALLPAAATTQ